MYSLAKAGKVPSDFLLRAVPWLHSSDSGGLAGWVLQVKVEVDGVA